MKRFKFKGGIYHEHFISVWWRDEFVNFGGGFEQGSPKQRSYLEVNESSIDRVEDDLQEKDIKLSSSRPKFRLGKKIHRRISRRKGC